MPRRAGLTECALDEAETRLADAPKHDGYVASAVMTANAPLGGVSVENHEVYLKFAESPGEFDG